MALPEKFEIPELQKAPPLGDKASDLISATKADALKNSNNIQVSNEKFIDLIFRNSPDRVYPAICSKPQNPENGAWIAKSVNKTIPALPIESNNYVNCSSFNLAEGSLFNVRKENFHALHFLLLDDIGTKIQWEKLAGFDLSWLLETSPGNYQAGIILDKPITVCEEAERLVDAFVKAGLTDPGASGVNRWARLPNGINGKPKYIDRSGMLFPCRLVHWNPEKRYTQQEIAVGLKLNLSNRPAPKTKLAANGCESKTEPTQLVENSNPRQPSSSKPDSQKLKELQTLVRRISPDCEYSAWIKVLMVIFNETGNSNEGFALADEWSSKGNKYKGSSEIKVKWKSFIPNPDNPVTIATLHKMITDSGGDLKVNPEPDDSLREYNDHENIQPSGSLVRSDILAEHEVASRNVLDSAQRLDPLSFPDKPKNESSRVLATVPNVKHMLNSYGITVRYNTIKKKLMISIPGFSGVPDNVDNVSLTHIISLATLNSMQHGQIPAYVEAIADQSSYNPVTEWIESKPWDGKNRLQEFFETLTHHSDFPKELKEILLKKWLLSTVAAVLKPGAFKARGVLTLQGPQSIGKTSWVNALVSDLSLRENVILLDHHLDAGNKDSIITAVSHWIVEIGELDSSFKKDISRLKGFLTKDYDKIRRPYSKANSEYPRRTVFCATVNDHNFLVDSTGNTRWWTIPVIDVNYKHNIDMQQVFAQLVVDFNNDMQWWLTPDEEKLLEEHNADHRETSMIREKILEFVDLDRMSVPNQPAMKAIDVLVAIGIDRPSNSQCKECAAILRELLGDPKRIRGENKWRIPKREKELPDNYGEVMTIAPV